MDMLTLASRIDAMAEGLRLTAYWDSNGRVWTIGFGHTRGVKQGDHCTVAQALAWLEEDNAALIGLVRGKPTLEGGANLSFGYNCGIGRLEQLLAGEILVTEDGFTKDGQVFGETSGGVILPGLSSRRKLEAALIMVSRG